LILGLDRDIINGYSDNPNVVRGNTLRLHVSTDAPQFCVQFSRQGARLQLKQTTGWLTGLNVPNGVWYSDWNWPGYDFEISSYWQSCGKIIWNKLWWYECGGMNTANCL